MQLDDPQFNDPQIQELTATTDTLLATASNFRVRTATEFTTAGLELQRVKAAQKRLDELRRTMTRPLDAAKKAIMDFFRAPEEKLATAEGGIKRAMIDYQNAEDLKRRQAQAKADEIARLEREKLAAQAAKAAAKGKLEQAGRLEQRAASVVAPIVFSEAPKVKGVTTREVWMFEVVEPDEVPREFCSVDEAKIRRVVNALKGDTKIAGVRIWSEKQLAARRTGGQE